MSALTETPPRPPLPVQKQAGGLRLHGKAGGYWVGFLIAVGIHGGLLFFWPHSKGPDQQVEFAVEAGDASVEVTLVAAPPAEDNAPPVEQPPDPTPQPPPPPPEPTPEPPPPPLEKPAEMTLPEPPPKPPEPEQKREPAPKLHPPKAQPKPHTEAPTHRAVGDGSSAIPGNDATTAKAASGASSKPGYLRNPHPPYPEEARAARQQGVVSLHVNVDASGHVASVRVAHSSGFPILDERARSTVADRWAFKPASTGGVPVASEVVIPIRFTLDH